MSTHQCESCDRPAAVELPIGGDTFRLCIRCVPVEHLEHVTALPGAEEYLELMRGFIAAHQPPAQPATPALTTGGSR